MNGADSLKAPLSVYRIQHTSIRQKRHDMAGPRGWFTSSLWLGDEELAKKDDDLPIARSAKHGTQWKGARVPRRRVLGRFALYLVAAIALVFLLRRITYTPEEDIVRPYSTHRFPDYGKPNPKQGGFPPRHRDDRLPAGDIPSQKAQDMDAKQKQKQKQGATYNGPIRFPALGDSLRKSGMMSGPSPKNRNVVFAAASLQSAATLLPLACQMAAEELNTVHFALLSRSDISFGELLKTNGIDKGCQIATHGELADVIYADYMRAQLT